MLTVSRDPLADELARLLWLGLGISVIGLGLLWKRERDAGRVDRKVMAELRANNPALKDRGWTVERWAGLARGAKLGLLRRVRTWQR